MTLFEPHEAEAVLVTTVIGSDGVRWACVHCNQTVYTRNDVTLHFDETLNPTTTEETP